MTKRNATPLVVVGLLSASFACAADPERESLTLGSMRLLADTAHRLELGAGAFNFLESGTARNNDASFHARATLFVGRKWYLVGPMAGILANADGGVFGYGGFYADVRVGRRWHLVPELGIGGYAEGDSKDLGGVFQFHLAVSAAYGFDNGSRLGIKFSHISNAGIHGTNPGTESLLVTYTIPISGF